LNFFRVHPNRGSSLNIKNYNNVKEYYFILNYLFNNIQISSLVKLLAKKNAFNLWYYQSGGSLINILSNQFITILKNAFIIDKFILVRFIKNKIIQTLSNVKRHTLGIKHH